MSGQAIVAKANTSSIPSVADLSYTSTSVVFQSCASEDGVMTVVDVQSCL